MPAARVVVVGSLNLDLVYRVAHLPRPGETLLGAGLTRLSGGKGGNQAHAAAKIAPGAPPGTDVTVAMIACVGDDEAAGMLRSDLDAVGVDTRGIHAVAGPSGTALIAVDDAGENTIVVIPGANAAWPSEVTGTIELRAGDVVVLQLEIPFELVEAVVALSVAVGARVVLNAAPLDRRAAALLRDVEVLVVNEIEAAELFGLERVDADSVGQLGADSPAALVVTLGAHGILVAPRGEPVETVPAFAVEAVDTVGAGDAFVGGFALALASGAPLSVAARWGAAAGALTATVPGARHPGLDRAAVEALAGALR
jgi:ribokinase